MAVPQGPSLSAVIVGRPLRYFGQYDDKNLLTDRKQREDRACRTVQKSWSTKTMLVLSWTGLSGWQSVPLDGWICLHGVLD